MKKQSYKHGFILRDSKNNTFAKAFCPREDKVVRQYCRTTAAAEQWINKRYNSLRLRGMLG